ncbi:MAG: GAF domain-containing protein [Nitrospirae bacterium]|nr:GAF domain-containing protein [Nitrospirota bacterium]
MVTCPHCGHEQVAATYCGRCRVHVQLYGSVKEHLGRLEKGLEEVKDLYRSSAPGLSLSMESLKGLVDAYRALRGSFEKLSRSQRDMATLAEVGKMINSVLAMDRLLDLIMDMAIKVMNAERGFLMLKNAETGELAVQVARNMEAELRDQGQWAISSNISSRVASEGQPILATDAQQEDRFQGMQSVMAHNIRSLLCVPLKLKTGEIIGVIYVDNRLTSGVFSEESVEFLTGFAHQAVIAIENARLYENVQKETKARMNLQRYLSPNLVEDVMNRKEVLTLGGKRVNCSVLFADICGFTPLSQKLEPEQVVGLLNEYFTAMTDIIFQYQGTLDKFIGDAIMAVFGAPVVTPSHARNAVSAAIAMQKEARRLREKLGREGTPAFQIRIGVNSGDVVAGNIGAPSRIEYTVIGDHVNLASRLESSASPDGILISGATYRQVKDLVQARNLPPIEVKGRTGSVEVYEVLDLLVQEKQGKDLRRHNRQDEVSLFAVCRDPRESRVYQGTVKNISVGGVQLNTREALGVGVEIAFSFSLPGGEKLGEILGRIVRSQDSVDDRGRGYCKLGIEFTKCAEADRQKIIRAWRLVS